MRASRFDPAEPEGLAVAMARSGEWLVGPLRTPSNGVADRFRRASELHPDPISVVADHANPAGYHSPQGEREEHVQFQSVGHSLAASKRTACPGQRNHGSDPASVCVDAARLDLILGSRGAPRVLFQRILQNRIQPLERHRTRDARHDPGVVARRRPRAGQHHDRNSRLLGSAGTRFRCCKSTIRMSGSQLSSSKRPRVATGRTQ